MPHKGEGGESGPGRVNTGGKASNDMPPGMLDSVLKQAGPQEKT
jgi:predicted RNA binding protein YcfA (HicA-like mRNA interferase family)